VEPSKSPKQAEGRFTHLRVVDGYRLPGLPPDQVGVRLRWAILLSVVLNATIWLFIAHVVRTHLVMPPKIITIQRVFITKDRKITVIKPKKPVVAHPKPAALPVRHTIPPRAHTQPPPPPPQVHVMTPNSGATTGETAAPGGSAAPGNIASAPPTPTPPAPTPSRAPEPTPTPTPPAPAPAPTPQPKPAPHYRLARRRMRFRKMR